MPDLRIFADGSAWGCHGPREETQAALRELSRELRLLNAAPAPAAPAPPPPARRWSRPEVCNDVPTLCLRSELRRLEEEESRHAAAAAQRGRDAEVRVLLAQEAEHGSQRVAADELDARLALECAAAESAHYAGVAARRREVDEAALAAAEEHISDDAAWRAAEGERERLERAREKVRREFNEAERRAAQDGELDRMGRGFAARVLEQDAAFIAQEQETEKVRRLYVKRIDADAEGEERARMRQIRIDQRGYTAGYRQME